MAHLQPITPLTIEAIYAHKWVGNAWSDGPAFNSIAEFAADASRPTVERAGALRTMARKGMGLKGDDAGDNLMDSELVIEFMESQ